MDKRGILAGLCAAVVASGLTAGCGEQGSNIPEEKVITQERSDEMLKKLEEGRKAMGKTSKK